MRGGGRPGVFITRVISATEGSGDIRVHYTNSTNQKLATKLIFCDYSIVSFPTSAWKSKSLGTYKTRPSTELCPMATNKTIPQ